MPANTDVGFCNEALQLLGSKPINGFDDGTDKSGTCALLYDRTVGLLLSMRTWAFTKKTRQLARLSATPIKWKYQFQLPSDMIAGPWAVYPSAQQGCDKTMAFDIFEDKLLSNDPIVVIDYQIRPAEAKFPAAFSELVVNTMAWKLAPSIAEDSSLAALYREIAFGMPSELMRGGLYAIAAQVDAKSKPSDTLIVDEVVAARFS